MRQSKISTDVGNNVESSPVLQGNKTPTPQKYRKFKVAPYQRNLSDGKLSDSTLDDITPASHVVNFTFAVG
jgi:hypothetical protein